MNSKSTQIWAMLRHLALVCVIVVGVLSILNANLGVFVGTFTSSSTAEVVQAFGSADKTFAATWSCDTADGSVFVGFPVDCSFFISNKQ